MALLRVTQDSPLSTDEAWRRLTRWERHGDVIPLTTVVVTSASPHGVGTTFVARTGGRRVGFDDPMEVVAWQPPGDDAIGVGRCRVEKRGTVITGWNEIEVWPRGIAGCHVVWREDVRVRWLPRPCDPVLAVAARGVFGRAVGQLLRDRR